MWLWAVSWAVWSRIRGLDAEAIRLRSLNKDRGCTFRPLSLHLSLSSSAILVIIFAILIQRLLKARAKIDVGPAFYAGTGFDGEWQLLTPAGGSSWQLRETRWERAVNPAYKGVDPVEFDNMFCRGDKASRSVIWLNQAVQLHNRFWWADATRLVSWISALCRIVDWSQGIKVLRSQRH